MTNAKPASKTRANVTPDKTAKPSRATPPKLPAAPVPTAASPKRAVARPAAPDAGSSANARPKHKLVRDSFTIPKSEYIVLEGLKMRAAKLARPTKKSELIRAGIVALNSMTDKAFLAAIGVVPSIKTGRPKNEAETSREP